MTELIELSVDEKGRIVIPRAVQHQLGLEPGMTLTVEDGENGGIRLRPEAEGTVLVEKQGILVVRAPALADLTDVVRRERDRRVRTLHESTGL